jgi:hypothetical protein
MSQELFPTSSVNRRCLTPPAQVLETAAAPFKVIAPDRMSCLKFWNRGSSETPGGVRT